MVWVSNSGTAYFPLTLCGLWIFFEVSFRFEYSWMPTEICQSVRVCLFLIYLFASLFSSLFWGLMVTIFGKILIVTFSFISFIYIFFQNKSRQKLKFLLSSSMSLDFLHFPPCNVIPNAIKDIANPTVLPILSLFSGIRLAFKLST